MSDSRPSTAALSGWQGGASLKALLEIHAFYPFRAAVSIPKISQFNTEDPNLYYGKGYVCPDSTAGDVRSHVIVSVPMSY